MALLKSVLWEVIFFSSCNTYLLLLLMTTSNTVTLVMCDFAENI